MMMFCKTTCTLLALCWLLMIHRSKKKKDLNLFITTTLILLPAAIAIAWLIWSQS